MRKAQETAPSVLLPSGTTLNGMICPGKDDEKCFFGIPYAEPPVGDLRFRPPQEYTWTTDIYQATE
jgi:carboxylesterase type B